MLQIILMRPEALVSEIRWLADQKGRPEAEIIREALGSYLTQRRLAIACPTYVRIGHAM